MRWMGLLEATRSSPTSVGTEDRLGERSGGLGSAHRIEGRRCSAQHVNAGRVPGTQGTTLAWRHATREIATGALGAAASTRVRNRWASLPPLRIHPSTPGRHRGPGGRPQDPRMPGPPRPSTAARARVARRRRQQSALRRRSSLRIRSDADVRSALALTHEQRPRPKPRPPSWIPNSLPAALLRPPLGVTKVKGPRTRLAIRLGKPGPPPHVEIVPATNREGF